MDRSEWRAERRRHVVADYDDIAAEYDIYDSPRDAQTVWVGRMAG